ncbi:unnamed protein product [Caretta caretta]
MGKDVWRACLQLCFIAIVVSRRREGRAEFPGNLSCLNNYLYRIDCTWETDGRVGDGPFHVHFTNAVTLDENYSCTLTARDELHSQHHCTINTAERFTQQDNYSILLQGGFSGRNRTYVAFPEYEPSLNIKCDPPFNLQSNISASKCQLWWSVPWSLENILQYELEYKEHNTSWEQAQHKQLFNSVTKVPKKFFHRSMIQILFIPLCLGVILYIILNFKLSLRAKNIFCLNVPTPAAFFQPLYTLHNGNFKDWIGPNETCGQLRRDDANNPGKVTMDGVPGLSAHDVISQLSFKSLAKTKIIPQEDPCGPASRPDQQYLQSRYVSVEEVEARLPSLFLQNHADDAGALDFSERSDTNLGSPDMSGNHPPYLRDSQGDFFMPQESLELESLSFCSNDYCTLCGSYCAGGPIPAELLQLTEEDGQVKH